MKPSSVINQFKAAELSLLVLLSKLAQIEICGLSQSVHLVVSITYFKRKLMKLADNSREYVNLLMKMQCLLKPMELYQICRQRA